MESEKSNKVDISRAPHLAETEKLTTLDEIRIPVIEEKATITKELFESGRVKITKQVDDFEEVVSVDLNEEEISVERKPMNQHVLEAPTVRQEGDTTIYPVLKEIVVVEKRLMLVEEIHITKKNKVRTTDQTVALRRERINVERENFESDFSSNTDSPDQ
ncbi:YsnF/AvaK domain-containing protein [Persicitalea sp.]|uniref:YsnF/AvaK domain-containing protein n=1 Tax=Persicitalea sp. TaxID=3100273 RepID=UPI0035936BD2